ncbi:hypothetical protein BpHYR1_019985 [Brachionus plicatilis]|uniref:Uncharacterized protein n=1 Tax=Brachionus plicatilis TaxID=10195 RepID=A0A3M7RZW5_BRAPC|nr:hypothetical protein BpHYR1_019985 [Brachionus plicatilis]
MLNFNTIVITGNSAIIVKNIMSSLYSSILSMVSDIDIELKALDKRSMKCQLVVVKEWEDVIVNLNLLQIDAIVENRTSCVITTVLLRKTVFTCHQLFSMIL